MGNSTQKSFRRNPRQRRRNSFENFMSSLGIDLLKNSLPGTPKSGSGCRPRSASSAQSCNSSTRPRSASSAGSTRPGSASSVRSSMQSDESPMSASYVSQALESGSQSPRRNRSKSATLGSFAKSFKSSKSTSKISPESPKIHAQQKEP